LEDCFGLAKKHLAFDFRDVLEAFVDLLGSHPEVGEDDDLALISFEKNL
jgi:hypothetical protein